MKERPRWIGLAAAAALLTMPQPATTPPPVVGHTVLFSPWMAHRSG